MNQLTGIPNIGKVLAAKLEMVGITTHENLKQVGAENAFIKLVTIDETTCICTLYALEGAIQETRWHNLPKEKKDELLEFYNHCHATK